MGRFVPKFTQDQRQAVARLFLDDGMTGVDVVAAAAAGIDGLEPFAVSKATVYEIANKARRHRQREAVRTGDYAPILARADAILQDELTAIEQRQRLGAPLDRGALQRVKIIRQAYSAPSEPPRDRPEHPEDTPKRTTIEKLIEEEEQREQEAGQPSGQAQGTPDPEASTNGYTNPAQQASEVVEPFEREDEDDTPVLQAIVSARARQDEETLHRILDAEARGARREMIIHTAEAGLATLTARSSRNADERKLEPSTRAAVLAAMRDRDQRAA